MQVEEEVMSAEDVQEVLQGGHNKKRRMDQLATLHMLVRASPSYPTRLFVIFYHYTCSGAEKKAFAF